MKKLIAIILLLAILLPMGAEAELYLRFGNVVDLEYDCDCVTVDDGMGNLWEFYGVDYFFFDDLAVMIMSDNDTPDWIYDDIVVNAYRCDEEDAEQIIQEYKNHSKYYSSFLNFF